MTLIDAIFVTWTYNSLSHITGELTLLGQTAKAKMYDRCVRVDCGESNVTTLLCARLGSVCPASYWGCNVT